MAIADLSYKFNNDICNRVLGCLVGWCLTALSVQKGYIIHAIGEYCVKTVVTG